MDWLRIAQSLPIGHSTRVRHGMEARENLVIHNRPDRWSAWCFRCNRGWTERKTHVKQLEVKMDQMNFKELPKDLAYPSDAILADRLFRYGITLNGALGTFGYFPRHSATQNRLYLIKGTQWEGRYTGHNPNAPKWVHSHPYTELETPGPTGCHPKPAVAIVVEDVLSALKLAYAIRHKVRASVFSTHGTGLNKAAFRRLVQFDQVYTVYDGDEAGDQAFRQARRKLSPFGITVTKLTIPEGKDPKDLDTESLCNLIPE